MTPYLFSQIPDSILAPLLQAGPIGIFVVWLMWRDGKERDRQEKAAQAQADALAKREDRRDARLDALMQCMHNLLRMTNIEVMSRPNISERIREETRDLMSTIGERHGPDQR